MSFTGVPVVKEPTQVEPHLMPAGELVTEPPPKPPLDTVSVCPMSTTWALLPTAFWKWTIERALTLVGGVRGRVAPDLNRFPDWSR